MARISLIFVIATALVAAASASGDDDNDHRDHGHVEHGHVDHGHGDDGLGDDGHGDHDHGDDGHGDHGRDDHCDSTGEWGEIEVYLKHSRKELRDMVRACFVFLVRRGVQPKEAVAWDFRSIEFMLELWIKVLHKHRSFQVDLSSLDTVVNEARGSVPWVGHELEETDKYIPGLLQCLPKHGSSDKNVNY